MTASVPLGFRVPFPLAERIERIRNARNTSRTDVVLEGLERGIAAMEHEQGPSVIEAMRAALRSTGRTDVDELSDEYVRGWFDGEAQQGAQRDAARFLEPDAAPGAVVVDLFRKTEAS